MRRWRSRAVWAWAGEEGCVGNGDVCMSRMQIGAVQSITKASTGVWANRNTTFKMLAPPFVAPVVLCTGLAGCLSHISRPRFRAWRIADRADAISALLRLFRRALHEQRRWLEDSIFW